MIIIIFNPKGSKKVDLYYNTMFGPTEDFASIGIKEAKNRSLAKITYKRRLDRIPVQEYNIIPDIVKDKNSKDLHLIYSCSGSLSETNKAADLFNINFDPIIKLIKNRYKHARRINVIPFDVVAWDESIPKKNYPEFQLWRKLQEKIDTPIRMFHYHIKHTDFTEILYSDIYAYTFINMCKPLDIPCNYNNVYKKLSCLNNASREHRNIITVLLRDFDILLTHRATLEARKFNFIDPQIKEKYDTQLPIALKQFAPDEYWNWDQLRNDRLIDSYDLIQKSFCHIVTEDPYDDLQPRVSDKTLKPLFAYRPFLLLGSCYTLEWLRNQGFQTFSKWWDESYDSMHDHRARLEAVYRNAEYINSLSLSDCKQLLQEMKPVLEHNANHLSVFQKATYANLLA